MARTIPEGWTQGTACLSSGDLWGWGVPNGGYADILGGPAETSSCYPPDYQPKTNIIYATDACPGAYTPACSTQTNGNWWTICCPTAYQFRCDATVQLATATMFCNSPYPGDAAAEWVTSRFTMLGASLQSIDTFTATLQADNQGTPSPIVVTTDGPVTASDLRGPGAALWAMAVLITSTSSSNQYRTTTPTTEDSGSTATASIQDTSQATGSPSTSPTAIPTAAVQTTGLSTGAAVGIGVGATAAALLVVLGGWLLYRRGVVRGQRASEERLKEEQRKSEQQAAGNGDITAGEEWSTQYHGYGYDHGVYRWPQELEPTPPAPRELELAPPRPRELE